MEYLCNETIDNVTTLVPCPDEDLFPGEKVVWRTPDYIGWIKLSAYAAMIIGGLIGNIGVILTVVFIRSMRTTINIYIANLAVADALICIICMSSHAITVSTRNHFVLGEFMCKFNPFTQLTCLTSSVLTLSAISCDRFIAILFPLHVRVTKQRTSVVMTIIWIISIIVAVPFLIVKKYFVLEYSDFSQAICGESWPRNYHPPLQYMYSIGISIMLFFLPVLIMVTAYSLIIWRLWRSEIPGEQHEANVKAHSKSRKKVIKMVVTVLIAFVICWSPLQFILLYNSNDVPAELVWFSYFFAYANSFINPFIYGGFNKSFRDGFCTVLKCGCKRDSSGRLGPNIFVKSIRSMNTTLTSLGNRKQTYFTRRKSEVPMNEVKVSQPTDV